MLHLRTLAENIVYLEHLSYPGVFLAVLASGHLIPVPEGVTLIILGFLAAIGKGNLLGFIITGVLATACYDFLLYGLTYGGSRIAASLSRRVNDDWKDRYKEAGEFRIFSLVFISHFIPGWRFLNPAILAVIKLPLKKFIPYTFISCTVYASLYVMLGYIFHTKFLLIAQTLASLHLIGVLSTLAVILLIVVAWSSFKRRKNI